MAGGSYTRTGTASYTTANGTRTFVATDILRSAHNNNLVSTNKMRNPDMLGAVVGGAFPTLMSVSNGTLLAVDVVGTGRSLDGYGYIDVRIQGTMSGTTTLRFNLNNYPIQPGSWNFSAWYGVISGSWPGTWAFSIRYTDGTAVTTNMPQVNSTVQRQSLAFTVNNYVFASGFAFNIAGIATGDTVNTVVRFGGLQLEPNAVATPYLGSSVTVAANGVNYAHAPQRVLIEPTRTNSVRNARFEGSTAGIIGSGGVLPTNMTVTSGTSALSTQVVGTGTEYGLPYVDIRHFGTSAALDTLSMLSETTVNIPASNGQVWTYEQQMRIVAGDMTGLSAPVLGMFELTAAGGNIISGQTSITQRNYEMSTNQYTRTLSGGGTVGNVSPFFALTVANAGVVDITMRYYAPQIELGGSRTTRILPGVGTPGASTRGDDILTRALTSSFNRTAGSYIVRFTPLALLALIQGIIALDDGTFNNRLFVYLDTSSTTAVLNAFSGGGNTIFFGIGSIVYGQENALAIAYTATGVRVSINGGAVITLVGAIPLSVLTTQYTGSLGVGNNMIQATYTSITYYPSALSDAMLRSASTI